MRQSQKAIEEFVRAGIYAGSAQDPSRFPFATPWGSGALQRWAFTDAFGEVPTNTREAAMAIPALARGRNLVCTSIGKLPLVELEGEARVAEQPNWITQTGDGTSPQLRMVWTVDDLIFYGLSLWWRNDSGKPTETRSRVNWDDWEIDTDRREVLVNGSAADPSEVILIPGFHEGVLDFAKESIDDTRTLYRNVRQRIQNPVPGIDLHQIDGPDLTDAEIDDLVSMWAAARAGANGGVAFTHRFIEAKPMGSDADASLMIEARNAAAVDAARNIGVHAGQVDATAPKASLNYETQSGRNEEFLDFDLDLYMEPITARLSLDDSTAPGRRIAFDRAQFTTLTPSPTGPALED